MSTAERYLTRIGAERPASLDIAALQTLLEAHLRAIPFENITSFLGSPVNLKPEACLSKLLEDGRGGYCMEHALVSRSALGDLGFQVEQVMCRVFFLADSISTKSHAITAVSLDGKTYIYDPGFGAQTPSIPICVDGGGGEQVGKYGKWRLRRAADTIGDTVNKHLMAPDVTNVLEWAETPEKWTALYGLTSGPVVPADVEAFNWWVSTCPASFFTRNVLCAAWDGANRVTGFDRNFKKRTGADVEKGFIAGKEDVDRWLRKEVGLSLSDEEVGAVWKKLELA